MVFRAAGDTPGGSLRALNAPVRAPIRGGSVAKSPSAPGTAAGGPKSEIAMPWLRSGMSHLVASALRAVPVARRRQFSTFRFSIADRGR